MAKRLRQPPERELASTSRSWKPARPTVCETSAWRSLSDIRASAADRSTMVRTVSPGANSEICSTMIEVMPLRMATSPASGSILPLRISNRVDLPEPFGPIIPIRSPSETVKDTS